MTTHRTSKRRLAAGTAVVLAAMLTATACGGADKKDDKGAASGGGFNAGIDKVSNASDKKGGELKFVGTQDADSWDPQRGYYGFMWDFSRYYTRQLVSFKPVPGQGSTELVPDLATAKAEISDGGKTYKYTLKDNVTWEDGSPVTAQDIKYGIERTWAQDVISGGPVYIQQVLDPKAEYPGPYKDTAPDKLGLKAIETPDAKTIVFKLPTPNGDFEQMLAMPAASPVKQDKDTAAKYGLKPFSNGPYKIDSYEPNKSMKLSRNENFKADSDTIRKALPDTISVTFMANADDMDKRLMNGEFDVDINATGIGQAARATALKDHKGNLDNGQTGFIRYAVMPQTVAPFDNIECRKAVIYAADKKSLQTARGGPQAGGDIAPNMLPLGIKGSDAKYDPYEVLKNDGKPNLDKAKEALKACGKESGFKTTIAVRNNKPVEVATAVSLQNALKQVGIEADVDQFDGAQHSGIIGSPKVVKEKGYGIIIMGWGADFPTGQGFSQPLVDGRFILQSGNNNYSELNDPAINTLFDQAIAETDPAKAGDIYKQMNQKVSEAAVYLPFVFDKTITWRSSRLTNAYTTDAYNGRYDYASLGVVK
ncbi:MULTISPECIES: ABC transporter substrate-binding protein [Streptomyces]|uniref:ABC transporter substrate-binding protein n=1 Tax=Streptomyces TaxID=1883 RepID=UPI0004BDA65B|nr:MULTISPECIES: ABC transporter substrate-binding protein [Streptomyces]MCI4083882.1 ABC transporter substrate-binding protein [Streptomyces sp. MMS21 TC-5]QNE25159.1 ABC transporter substrate-binding protein [Streptomyces sp. INR7]RST13652.1 ABC transporter substrate-binding protein [Streptomyces sp. WAC05950]GLV90398.1 peptide ABC transporter substrate-binding protein [Streptomyces lavendulae subsp. lavendulae]